MPTLQPVETDILFVVDNSGSMADIQQRVATDIPVFVAELQKSGGVANNFRVGVTTTSVYQAYEYYNTIFYDYYPQAGWLLNIPLLDGGVGTERYLDDSDPDLVPRFALAMTAVGVDGSGQETPFEATRIALQNAVAPLDLPDGGPANRGFLRDGARLMVVAVSDEDDCSETRRPPLVHEDDADGENFCINQAALLTPVGDYYSLLTTLPDGQGGTRGVVWGSLAPVSLADKSAQAVPCDGDGGFALCNADCPNSNAPGTRLHAMALLFDLSLDNLYSVCADSYHDQLLALADIAAVPQTLQLTTNVPDPRLLVVNIVRADGSQVVCSVDNGGLIYEAAPDGGFPSIRFQGDCVRQQSDTQVTLRLYCVN